MAKSIYQLICDNIKDGVLEENFSAPDESDDSPIRWASGAMDGVYIFHMNHSGLNATQTKEMARALKAAACIFRSNRSMLTEFQIHVNGV